MKPAASQCSAAAAFLPPIQMEATAVFGQMVYTGQLGNKGRNIYTPDYLHFAWHAVLTLVRVDKQNDTAALEGWRGLRADQFQFCLRSGPGPVMKPCLSSNGLIWRMRNLPVHLNFLEEQVLLPGRVLQFGFAVRF